MAVVTEGQEPPGLIGGESAVQESLDQGPGQGKTLRVLRSKTRRSTQFAPGL